MELSLMGKQLTKKSGIHELMEDMGLAMCSDEDVFMLGGGNPAHIPEVNRIWRSRMEEILASGDEFERMVANYDTPRGKIAFLESVAEFFARRYGWDMTAQNVAVTNSSQTAFMMLLNMFAGLEKGGRRKKVLFPLLPEYVGYADQVLTENCMETVPGLVEESAGNIFKYRVDFDRISITDETGAVCVSRPTNPTGNVLTDQEIGALSRMTRDRDIPLLIDNAYGVPFPNIMFTDATPLWDTHIIYSMSLSKLGLPSTRTGIIIADKKIIRMLSACNAIVSLSCGTLGQMLAGPLIRTGEIAELCKSIIRPFYEKKSLQAREWVHELFNGQEYALHKSEGALFLWLWFKKLSVTTLELYEILKKRNVLVIPGRYFFYGPAGAQSPHRDSCIRINYSQDGAIVRKGLEIIAEEAKRYSRP